MLRNNIFFLTWENNLLCYEYGSGSSSPIEQLRHCYIRVWTRPLIWVRNWWDWCNLVGLLLGNSLNCGVNERFCWPPRCVRLFCFRFRKWEYRYLLVYLANNTSYSYYCWTRKDLVYSPIAGAIYGDWTWFEVFIEAITPHFYPIESEFVLLNSISVYKCMCAWPNKLMPIKGALLFIT